MVFPAPEAPHSVPEIPTGILLYIASLLEVQISQPDKHACARGLILHDSEIHHLTYLSSS